MASPTHRHRPRFRRRILGLGLLLTFALYVIGAPIFVNRVEDDLERRVPEELAADGFAGVTASFSGQDGALRCAQPLQDPEGAIQAAYDVWGVRAIELDRSCRVNRAPQVGDDSSSAEGASASSSGDDSGTVGDGSTSPTTAAATGFATVADAVANDPQFSVLTVLLQESGLDADLGDPDADPVTLFAPTDPAFDAIPADGLAQLRSDADLLKRVLTHHAAAGELKALDLVAGPLAMLDGESVDVAIDGDVITIGGATVTESDILTGNGVIHVVDRVLMPPDVDVEPSETLEAVTATYADATITLTGVVASEAVRTGLATAAAGAVGEGNVVDQLEVDPATGIDTDRAGSLGSLVAAMPAHLVSGVAGFDGADLYVRGAYATDADRDAMQTEAEAVGVAAELASRPDASDADASDLEARLNAYVAENPIRFEPGSAVLSPSATAILDRVAREAIQLAGLSITVEGHTDSDGAPSANLVLSQQRAAVVRQALVERGLDAASITAKGFGSEQPVLVGGIEDKAASRRVEFRVETA